MAIPEKLSQPGKQVSIERGGLGQSGYTAGRKEGDVALDDATETGYAAPPGSGSDGLGTDDRFTGRGGPMRDVDRDAPGAPLEQPYPHTSGEPDPASSEPDGASYRPDDDGDRDDALEPGDRTGRAGERADPRG